MYSETPPVTTMGADREEGGAEEMDLFAEEGGSPAGNATRVAMSPFDAKRQKASAAVLVRGGRFVKMRAPGSGLRARGRRAGGGTAWAAPSPRGPALRTHWRAAAALCGAPALLPAVYFVPSAPLTPPGPPPTKQMIVPFQYVLGFLQISHWAYARMSCKHWYHRLRR